jgi:ATP-dependent RNA helicase DeaD
LARFKEGQVELLVATDVAARGIDVEGVTHVINFDIAASPDSHVHRIGRTGRAGREGTAFTLIHPREVRQLKLIERATRSRIPRRRVPTAADVAERSLDLIGEKIGSMVNSGAGQDPRFVELAQRLLDDYEPERLVAVLVSSMAESRGVGAGATVPDGTTRDRAPSQDAFDFPETGAEHGYVRLFVNIGARQRVTPADFVRTIAREADISGSLIGAIDIHDDFTFVEVPKEVAHEVLDALGHAPIQGRGVRAEPARPMSTR